MSRHYEQGLLLVQRASEKALQRLLSFPAEAARWAVDLPIVEGAIRDPRYRRAIEAHRGLLPELNASDARIVDAVEESGVCVTSLDQLSLPGTSELVASARQLWKELALSARSARYRGRHTVTATRAQLSACRDIFLWGLNCRLLRIAERYLRLPAAYDGFSGYYSVADGREAGPRWWHRDREDRRMIKVGVYLNDVNETGGPFQLVCAPHNARVLEHTRHKYVTLSHRELHESLAMPESTWLVTCTGAAGTVIFADTARYFHRGKPPTIDDRCAIFFGYIARRPQHPFLCERSPFSRRQIRDLVHDLPSEQQAWARWPEALPAWLRWFPKNRVTV